LARADRRRAAREARHARNRPTTSRARAATEQDMFFPKLRAQAKWVFVFLALVFGLGFVLFGVGSGSGGLSDLLQGNFSNLFGGNSASKDADKARDRIKDHPNDEQAYLDLAHALEADGKPDEAISPLEKYRKLNASNVDALNELAGLYLRKADQARTSVNDIQATTAAQVAAARSIFEPSSDSQIGKALSGSADPLTGADPINQAVQSLISERSSKAFTEYTNAYKHAVSVYKDVTKASPTDSGAWFTLAQTAESASDTTTAVVAYKRFLELAPDDPNAPAVRTRLKQLTSPQSSASSQAGG
jgi:cytochrome c-type biogenesis protein CcmH/NrfG